jgi:hypothetical protein
LRIPIRLTLIIAFILTLSFLVVGALVPAPTMKASSSPYLSALSDVAVPSAMAVQCNTICYRPDQQSAWQCVHDFELGQLACHKFGNNQCENLGGLCG